jgi:hypothetical protein
VTSKDGNTFSKNFSPTPPSVSLVPISDPEVFESMGRLVRTVADFEIILDLYIARICGLSDVHYKTLVGFLPIRRKKEICIALAEEAGTAEVVAVKKVFTPDLEIILEARNAIAHGMYLGLTDSNSPIFGINRPIKEEGKRTGYLAMHFSPSSLRTYTAALNSNLLRYMDILQVSASFHTLQSQRLEPHPNASPKRPKSQAPKRPARSFRP